MPMWVKKSNLFLILREPGSFIQRVTDKSLLLQSFSGKIIVWMLIPKKPLSLLKGNVSDILSLGFNPVINNIAEVVKMVK